MQNVPFTAGRFAILVCAMERSFSHERPKPFESIDVEDEIIRSFLTEKRGDFDFHVERFRKQAEEYANRPWIWRLWTHGGKAMAAADFARKEALRDRADAIRRNNEEFRAWQHSLQSVIKRLLIKRDDPGGAGKDIHPLIFILAGGMRGPYSTGQLIGLNYLKLGDVFDIIFGLSAGAGAATYFSAGEEQSRVVASIFYDELTTGEFVNFLRLHQIMDISMLGNIMRYGKKKLDQEAVKRARHELYLGVTRKETLEPEFVNAKTAKPDIPAAVEASMAIPLLFRKAVEVNGIPYIDGAFDYLPVKKVIEKFHPTDILILANIPFDRLESFHLSLGEFLVVEMSSKLEGVESLKIVEKVLLMKEEFRKALEYIREQESRVNIGILWPPDMGLTTTGTDHDLIKAAVLESARDVISQFGIEQPEHIELYNG